jgi:hypothetical protein
MKALSAAIVGRNTGRDYLKARSNCNDHARQPGSGRLIDKSG